ncbi:MAG: single-stranded DNA-binding protein [Phycisphaerales bacterium]|nr:single-stranded DNA-binding protein [Phycisphaerales bacterium]
MASYNKVVLMGNLTRDVELRSTNNNQSVANLGLAVNRRYRTADGEDREEVTFVDCEAWGRTAETMAKYLSKGRPVFIEGRLKLDSWQDKDGNKQSRLRVVVENFQFIDSRGGGESRDDGGGRPAAAARSASAPARHDSPAEEDIPF